MSVGRRIDVWSVLIWCWLVCDAHVQGPLWLFDCRTLFVFLDPRAQTGKGPCFLELVVVAIVLPLSVLLPVEARWRPLLGDSEARSSPSYLEVRRYLLTPRALPSIELCFVGWTQFLVQ